MHAVNKSTETVLFYATGNQEFKKYGLLVNIEMALYVSIRVKLNQAPASSRQLSDRNILIWCLVRYEGPEHIVSRITIPISGRIIIATPRDNL